MRILLAIVALTTLGGCDTLGEVIREKKYTLQIHETPNSKQTFGYNEDYDYVGFMFHGEFGKVPAKHEHSLYCKHNPENNSQ